MRPVAGGKIPRLRLPSRLKTAKLDGQPVEAGFMNLMQLPHYCYKPVL